jgi:hypothetical protein
MAVLDIRPEGERRGKELPNGAPDVQRRQPRARVVRICTFECTFCASCTDGELAGICPNCGGNLVHRPTRPEELLKKYPTKTASQRRSVAHD